MIKYILRKFIATGAGLYISSLLIPGMSLTPDITTQALVVLALMLSNTFIKPILKLIFLPINLATFGFFSIVINALILFGIIYFFGGISISSWTMPSLSYYGFVIPSLSFGIISTYLFAGVIISITIGLFKWLLN